MAEDQASDPAKAFEDLRAEVSVLRKAVEALPAAIRENRPPDYAQDLAVIGKGLDEIGGQLDTIQKSPALRLSPEQQGVAIANAGRTMISEAADALRRAAQEADRERYNLSQMIGIVKAKRQEWRDLLWTAGVMLVIGLFVSPFIAGFLPFGLNARIAALVMMRDRWDAGEALMEAGNPPGWAQLVADTNLAHDNREKITACREIANKTKKDERCTITVQPSQQ
jgi:hypothetical protein